MKTFFYGAIFIFFTLQLNAQELRLTGSVLDRQDNVPLNRATVRLIQLPDSSVRGGYTDTRGNFSILIPSAGNYLVRVNFLGYEEFSRNITVTSESVDLGRILLAPRPRTTGEVEVVGRLPGAVQKRDTTQFAAGAYKTNPDASAEDLITKMPGVTLQDGKVQAQGEEVQQVLVDGKPFFGDDPNAALRNLPAEVIDRVQIYDQQSDQASFTGFGGGGNTRKTINVITKEDRRRGQFGRLTGGFGEDRRYRVNGNLNFFNGPQRISILAQSNNVSEQNFAIEDLIGAYGGGGAGGRGGMMMRGMMMRGGMAGGGMRGRMGGPGGGGMGGGMSDFLVNQNEGISTTHALGINYTDSWGESIDVTGSYFFNWTNNNADQALFRQYVLPSDSGQFYAENNVSESRNTNHRANFRFDWRIDTNSSIQLRPRLSLQFNNGASDLLGMTLLNQARLNEINNNFSSDLSGVNFSNDLLYRLRLNNQGRGFSVNVNTSYNDNKGNSDLFSRNAFYSGASSFDTLNQNSNLDKNGWTVSPNLAYTEPLNRNNVIQLSYNASLNNSESDKRTFNEAGSQATEDILDTLLSSTFSNKFFTQAAGLGYRFQDSNFQASADVSYQIAQMSNEQAFPSQGSLFRRFYNLLPSANLRYDLGMNKNLNLFYRTSTNAPGIEQLQDVVNNANPIQLSRGNPFLRQALQHNLFMRYSSVSENSASPFFVMVGGSYVQDYIGNSTFIAQSDTVISSIPLRSGSQLTTPVNMDAFLSLRSFLVYGLPVEAISSNLNLMLFATFTRTPGLVNNEKNYSNSPSYGAGITLSSNISENLDFTVSSNSNYTIAENTLQTSLNNKYFNQNTRLRLNWIFWEGLSLQTDVNHQLYNGLTQGFNQNIVLWNASLGKKFLENNALEIRFHVFDILRQNNSVRRNITETYFEDVQTNILRRYAMLSVSYNIRNFAGGAGGMQPGGRDR